MLKNINTRTVHSVISSGNPTVYKIRWKKKAEPDTQQMTIQRMRLAGQINKVTDTHSEYVLIVAFHCNNGYANAPQRYVYTYTACLVYLNWDCILTSFYSGKILIRIKQLQNEQTACFCFISAGIPSVRPTTSNRDSTNSHPALAQVISKSFRFSTLLVGSLRRHRFTIPEAHTGSSVPLHRGFPSQGQFTHPFPLLVVTNFSVVPSF